MSNKTILKKQEKKRLTKFFKIINLKNQHVTGVIM